MVRLRMSAFVDGKWAGWIYDEPYKKPVYEELNKVLKDYANKVHEDNGHAHTKFQFYVMPYADDDSELPVDEWNEFKDNHEFFAGM